MSEELPIAPGTTLTVISHGPQALALEASYAGGGTPPPAHLHPDQDERFEVLRGAMQTKINGVEGRIAAGDVLEIPRGTAHKMWNGGAEPALMLWVTTPAGRTLDWFRELAALQRGEPLGDPALLLERYADVFVLADA
jgi:mannose-6-phosphate isomerase-like protein (cupin superfamily)